MEGRMERRDARDGIREMILRPAIGIGRYFLRGW